MKKIIIISMLWSLPSLAQELPPTPEQVHQTVAQNWAKFCAKCHEADGKATNVGDYLGAPADLNEATKDKTAEELFEIIAEGKNKKMPAFKKKLTQKEIENLSYYINYSSLVEKVMSRRERLDKELKRIKEDYEYLPECENVE